MEPNTRQPASPATDNPRPDTTRPAGSPGGSAEGSPASGYQRQAAGVSQTGPGVAPAGNPSQAGGDAREGSTESQRAMQPSSRGGALRGRHAGAMDPWGLSAFGGEPFGTLRRLSQEMDRIFESFGMGSPMLPSLGGSRAVGSGMGGGHGLQTLWSPHVDMFERDGRLVVQAELPGIPRDGISVEIEHDALVISGQRSQESSRDERGVWHSERRYGSFHRAIALPEGVDPESARATFRDGVLEVEIELPRGRQRSRRLEIRDGGAPIEGGAQRSMQGGASGASSGGAAATSSGAPASGEGMPGAQDVRTARGGLPGSDGFSG